MFASEYNSKDITVRDVNNKFRLTNGGVITTLKHVRPVRGVLHVRIPLQHVKVDELLEITTRTLKIFNTSDTKIKDILWGI